MTTFTQSLVERWYRDDRDPDVVAWYESDAPAPLTAEELAELEWQEVSCRLSDLGMYDN